MSYEKINFKNREVEKPLTFKKHVNDDGTITLEPKPGTIVEEGTPLLADHFNHMDDGIYRAHKEIDNLKLSGIERNKELVANLNSKKVSATTNDSLKTNIAKVKDIKLGSGNAVASDVLQGKTFSSSQGTDLTGTMPNRGNLNKTITTQGGKQIITPGYYEGGEVKAQFNNLVPENIKDGINIGGVVGTNMSFLQVYSLENSSHNFLHLGENYLGANRTGNNNETFVASYDVYGNRYNVIYNNSITSSFIGSSSLFTKDYMVTIPYNTFGSSSTINVFSKSDIMNLEDSKAEVVFSVNTSNIDGLPDGFRFRAYAHRSKVVYHSRNSNVVYLLLYEYDKDGDRRYVVSFDIDNKIYKTIFSWTDATDCTRSNIYNHKLYFYDTKSNYKNTKILDLNTKQITNSNSVVDYFISSLTTSDYDKMYEGGGRYNEFKVYQIN